MSNLILHTFRIVNLASVRKKSNEHPNRSDDTEIIKYIGNINLHPNFLVAIRKIPKICKY